LAKLIIFVIPVDNAKIKIFQLKISLEILHKTSHKIPETDNGNVHQSGFNPVFYFILYKFRY
jgi:hypothetical protein